MLIFAFILALGAASVSSDCTTAWSGPPAPDSSSHRIADAILGPGQSDWNLDYTKSLPCRYDPRLALQVTVCDDVAPVVNVPSVFQALVHRRGTLQQVAVVQSVFWCPPGTLLAKSSAAVSSLKPVATPARD